MKKIVKIDTRAEKELRDFSLDVQKEFRGLIQTLGIEGRLDLPRGKKIGSNLFEIRVKFKGEYRGLYAYVLGNDVIILHFFQKKSQKTPIKDLKVSERRLKDYEYRY
jgi:phage-related protein